MLSDEHYKAGRLNDAVAAAVEEVKAQPGNVGRRSFLAQLLCFRGDLERADVHLKAVGDLDKDSELGVVLMRQLLRAERSRREFYEAGRLPAFLDKPSEELQLRIKASVQLREGNVEEATELLAEAAKQVPSVSGECNGQPFQGLRDLDDLMSSVFEVLTTTAEYYWFSVNQVASLHFQAPQYVCDLLWRSVQIRFRGGTDGLVYMPTIYAGSHAHADEFIQLGRKTDWVGDEDGIVRGLGQRLFLLGEQDVPIMELEKITIASESGEA